MNTHRYRQPFFKGLIGLTFLTFLVTTAAQDQTAKAIENLNEQVTELVRQLRIDEAIPLAEHALEGARRLRVPKERNEVLLHSLINSASLEMARGRFDGAEELYTELVPIVRKTDPSSYEMVETLGAFTRTGALFQKGRVTEARLLAEERLTKARVLSLPRGIKNPVLAPSLQLLGLIYFALERFDDAEKLFTEEVTVLRNAPQEPLNVDTAELLAAGAHAHVLYQKGNVSEAVSLSEKTLRDGEALPPSRGKDLALVYGLIALADLYTGLDRDNNAQQLYSKALSLFKNVLSSGIPVSVLAIKEANARSRVLFANGKAAEAVSLAERALHDSRQIGDSPLVTTCLHTLALMYEDLGKYQDAEKRLIDELALLRAQLGEHPQVAAVLATLGVVYGYEGRYGEAENSYGEAMEMWKKFQLQEHPMVAVALAQLGALDHKEGRYGDAERHYKQALAMWEKLGIKQNPALASCIHNLAALYFDQSRFQDAERLFNKTQEMLDTLGYTNHPYVALLMSNEGRVYQAQGRYEEAKSLYGKALEMFTNLGIEEHPYRAQCLNNLALLYQEQKDYKKAEQYYVMALAIWNNLLPEHPDSAVVLSNLGTLYVDQHQFEKAKQPLLDALAIWQKRLPKEHRDVAVGLNNLAFFYYEQRQYREAEPLYRQAIKILRASLQNDNLFEAGAVQNFALVLWALQSSSTGSLEEVSQLLRESAQIRIAVLGRELVRGTGITTVKDNLARVLTFEGASADVALSFAARPQGLITNAEAAKTALLEVWIQKGRAQEEARRQSHQPQPLNVDEIRLQLPKGAALLEFALYHDLRPGITKEEMQGSERRYAACVLRWDRDDPVCLDLDSATDIERDTELFLKLARDVHSSGPLFDGLPRELVPTMKHLEGVEQLLVAEDGELSRVPLQALQTKEKGKEIWLDRFEITYLNSGRDLAWRRGEQAATGPAVVAGLNKYGEVVRSSVSKASSDDESLCPEDSSEFSRLWEAEAMAKLAARHFGVEPLIGMAAATEENLRKAVKVGQQPPRAVVLAFHGCIKKGGDGQEPELRLVVGNGKEGWTFLGATEVANWPLEGSGLYILACSAGSPVGEVVGDLRQAGTLAGVRYMIAPLWGVIDTDARYFLNLLLDEQKNIGNPAAALLAAQRKMRSTKGYERPFFWAGYTVNGVGALGDAFHAVKTSPAEPDIPTTAENRDIKAQFEVNTGGVNAHSADTGALNLNTNSYEGFYLGIPFGRGRAEYIHISNKKKNEEVIKIEGYSASGRLLENTEKTIPAGGNVDVRFGDSAQESYVGDGWIRVVSTGKGISVSDTQEVIHGNILTSVERGEAVSRKSADPTKVNHRWVLSLASKPHDAYFLNLSEHPVQVGFCQSNHRDSSCGTLDHTVAPMEQIGFGADQSHRYAIIESTPGSSVAHTLTSVDGNKRLFHVSTQLWYGNVPLGRSTPNRSPQSQAAKEPSSPKAAAPIDRVESGSERTSTDGAGATVGDAAAEQQDDVGPFKVLHDHSFLNAYLKSYIFQNDESCDGSIGIRNDVLWFQSRKKRKHSFSVPISQIEETSRNGSAGIITFRLRSGKKYKFYADPGAARELESRIQSSSR